MAKRICPSCGTAFPDTQTNCVSCSDTPVGLEPGTILQAALALGEVDGQNFKPVRPLGNDVFTIRRLIGSGNMALTYLVTDKFGNQRAVKEMRPHNKPKTQTHLLGCFLREADVQYRVGRYLASHTPLFTPLPKGYGCFEQSYGTGILSITRHYIVMDFMSGKDWDRIQGDPNPMGPLPLLDVLQLGMELCIILRDYLHGYTENGKPKPILHRDIKPANIMLLNATGTSCLLDFGIARFEEVSAATMARGGTRAGSGTFAPPEHSQRGAKITPSFDTYCICSSLYTLLGNTKDFADARQDQIDDIRAHVTDVELQAVLIKGTNEGIAGRYQTAEELRQALERVYLALRPLPSHLVQTTAPAPMTNAPGAAQPAPAPSVATTAAKPTIQWDKTRVRLAGSPTPNRFSKVLSGRVMQNDKPLPAVNVVVSRIVDDPGGPQSVNVSTIPTDIDGQFALDNADTTAGIHVQVRRVSIRVEDAGGLRLTTDERTISQPLNLLGNVKTKIDNAITHVRNNWLPYLLALCALVAFIGYQTLKQPIIWKAAGVIAAVALVAYGVRKYGGSIKQNTLNTIMIILAIAALVGYLLSNSTIWRIALGLLVIAALVKLFTWMFKSMSGPAGVPLTASLIGAMAFLGIAVFGIMTNQPYFYTLAPLGIVWSLVAPIVFRKGFLARLFQIAMFFVTAAWLGTWFIFFTAPR